MEQHEIRFWIAAVICAALIIGGMQACCITGQIQCEQTRREAIKAGLKAEVFIKDCKF